jgi:hypothetical protein
MAQQQRDRHRLLLCARTIEAADPIERIVWFWREAAPRVGGRRRSQSFRDEPNPSSAWIFIRLAAVGTLSRSEGRYSGK